MVLTDGTYFGREERCLRLPHFTLTLTAYAAGTQLPVHCHQNPYLSFLVRGCYRESGSASSFRLEPGHLIYRPAGHDHGNLFHESGLCFNMEMRGHDDLFPATWSDDLQHLQLRNRSPLALFRLYVRFLAGAPADELDLHGLEAMDQLFFGNNPGRRHRRTPWIGLLTDFIRAEADRSLSVEELAAFVHVHPVYLVRKFSEKCGLPLSAFIRRVRLERALHALLTSNASLTQIAHDSGFYDQSHFIRLMRGAFGVPPRTLRRLLKG